MAPSLLEGDVVVARRGLPKARQVAIFRRGDREVIKRVSEVKRSRYYLLGDNAEESTDSRHYGYVTKKDILGTIMLVLPRAVNPPKPLKPYGVWFGRVAALIFFSMALVHLFRIDTFIPLLDAALPSGPLVATWFALLIIWSEIFAIPFALGMKLSPLAHVVSGALVVFGPLWWVAVSIMTVGVAGNMGELGEFAVVPSTALLLGLNLVWAAFGFVTLYLLGYNNVRLRRPLRK